jgi:hypothetical protein
MPHLAWRFVMIAGRLRLSQVEWVADRLADRDWRIIEGVNTLRLLTGQQIERLYFADLKLGRSRTASRSRVLHRLVAWRVLVPLPRRIGGPGRGSTTLVFALDSAGQRLVRERLIATDRPPRVRRPGPPGERTVRHILAVSECCATLTELARAEGFTLERFQAEPASWWPNGLGGYIKPDAYAVLAAADIRDHWWIELDLATESLPTVRNQLLVYLDFARRGQLGPGQIVPRVAVVTITRVRRRSMATMVERLPPPADQLFRIVQTDELASSLYQVLRE